MIKGAIFDLDGTLLNSMFVWATIGERYLRSIGYEPRENLNETFRAMSLYQAACYYRKAYGVTRSVDEIMAEVNKMVEKYYREELILKAGAEAMLHGLRSRGISMCIATATDKYLVEAALKRCEVRGFFSEIFTCSSVGSGKDRPQIYREAASHLGYEPREILVFEDALYAAKTAAADGFDLVGVYDSSERSQDELRNISNLFLEDFSESNRQKLYAYIDQKGESL